MKISKSFAVFMQEAPDHAEAWTQVAKSLDAASALDKKTQEPVYVAVLAAIGNMSGLPFHVLSAKSQDASGQEVLSATLLGLPAPARSSLVQFRSRWRLTMNKTDKPQSEKNQVSKHQCI